jgi:bifunctional DNase/RNase
VADASARQAISPGPAPPSEPHVDAPVFRVMEVLSVSLDLPGQYPTVHLQEAEPPLRDLIFPIGLPEGVALAHALRKVATSRPLTHELFLSALQHLGADVATVRLVGRRGVIYLAELVLTGSRGVLSLPCRPSDGLTLALRQPVPAPVLADERLLEGPGDVLPASSA